MDQTLQHGHLDPDQINAFAEGVLPEHERLLVMAHLADCPNCRDVVFLAQEALAADSPAPAIADEPVRAPFWRRWFGPLPLAGAAALACAAVAFVMWRSPSATVQVPQNEVAAVKPEQSPRVVPPPPLKAEPAKPQPPAAVMAVPSVHARKQESAATLQAPAASPVVADAGSLTQPAPISPTSEARAGPPLPESKSVAAAAPSPAPPVATQNAALSQDAAPVPMIPPMPTQPSSSSDQLSKTMPARRQMAGNAGVVGGGMAAPSGKPALRAQSVRISGIMGSVTDPSGAAIPGVSVTARSVESNTTQKTTTNALGKFTLEDAPPGKYEVEFTAPGFQKQSQTVDLQSQQLAQVEAKLRVGTVSETVTVVAAANALDVASADLRRLSLCDDPLPAGKAPVLCQLSGSTAVAVNESGTVFLRAGNSYWKAVQVPWKASIQTLGTRGGQFEVVTADGSVWLSSNGRHWRPQPSH